MAYVECCWPSTDIAFLGVAFLYLLFAVVRVLVQSGQSIYGCVFGLTHPAGSKRRLPLLSTRIGSGLCAIWEIDLVGWLCLLTYYGNRCVRSGPMILRQRANNCTTAFL